MSRPLMLGIGTAAGLVLGILVALISRLVSRRLKKGDFWAELPGLARSLAAGSDHGEFVRAYSRLVKLLGAYLSANAVQLAAAFTPVVATVVLCGPPVMEAYNRGAVGLAIHPRQQVTIEAAGERFESQAAGALIQPMPRVEGAGKAVTAAGEFAFDSLARNNAWCTSGWGQWGMSLLGFDTHASTADQGSLILRPYCGDWNPLWPYLNDLEFCFYLAITLASASTAVFLKKRAH